MIATIRWSKGRVRIIDQTKLPLKLEYLNCQDVSSIWRAIREMKIRGAPAIGIAAAFGVVLGMRKSRARDFASFSRELGKVVKYLSGSRPTAVNLFWALERMKRAVKDCRRTNNIRRLKKALLEEAIKILEEDKIICRKMADFGSRLIKDGDTILTHCNAGALATADYGTALGVIYRSVEQGKEVSVYVDESRPLLQGARLSAWELTRKGIHTTLICDDMAGSVMKEGRIDKILVGADRIAANGDVANKIGTYSLAVLAKVHRVPFYVVAPVSTFDLKIKSGRDIPIEERSPEEITMPFGQRIAPRGVGVYNPAFDVTPAGYISAIITEKGILRPPYTKSLKKLIG